MMKILGILLCLITIPAIADTNMLKPGKYCANFQLAPRERQYQIMINNDGLTATCLTRGSGFPENSCDSVYGSKLANWRGTIYYAIENTNVYFVDVGNFSFTPNTNQLVFHDNKALLRFFYTGDNACW